MKQIAETLPSQIYEKPKVDIYQKVTDTIVRHLEEGTTPWQKPWDGGADTFYIPQNGVSGKQYNGVNVLLLWGTALEREYKSHEWASFRQWNNQKESIRKGEKGTMVVYYDFIEKEEDGDIKKVPFIKSYLVFNRCQLNSFQPDAVTTVEEKSLAERLEHVETFVKNTNAIIKYKGNRACFIPSLDEIHMPRIAKFTDTEHSTATENFYSTLSHELVHWAGHSDRLNRDFGKRFGDHTYAAEELVAELGSAFLCATLSISRETRKDHANYIANWLQALKGNKYLITTAANAASRAVDYLNKLQP